MSNFLTPGVFLQDVSTTPVSETSSNTIGGMIGVAERGPLNLATLITSWNAYLDTFAYGMETPFLVDSELAYAVYGFFQNGGKKVYITRIASDTVALAKVQSPDVTPTITIQAKNEGAWGNNIKVTISENTLNVGTFDVVVKYKDVVVEKFNELTNILEDSKNWIDILEVNSKYINGSGDISAQSELTLTGGVDGIDDITDTNFSNGLSSFDNLNDLTLFAIPGQTSTAVLTAIVNYTNDKGSVFPILDAPKYSTVESVNTLRRSLNVLAGSLNYPQFKIVDPNSNTGKLRDCPTCGHIMGVYARVIESRGIWKAPAGVEANIVGAVELLSTLTKDDTDTLNPLGVNCILSLPNYGICVWGARSLNNESNMTYVSDVLLNILVKKDISDLTQKFVFEPNTPNTWVQVQATVQAYLENLFKKGGLAGSTSKEAYIVKCDSDNNTNETIARGELICDVGYASQKPAEFVVFRISHINN